MQRTVEDLYGQLVRIDNSGSVQLVYSTARDFLLDRALESNLAVRGTDTQGRLAKSCVEHMSGVNAHRGQMLGSRDLSD